MLKLRYKGIYKVESMLNRVYKMLAMLAIKNFYSTTKSSNVIFLKMMLLKTDFESDLHDVIFFLLFPKHTISIN